MNRAHLGQAYSDAFVLVSLFFLDRVPEKDAEGSQHGPQLHDFMHSFPQTRRRSATDACLWLPRANRSLHDRFPSVRSRIPAKVCSSVPAAQLLAGPVVGQKACVVRNESTAGLDSTQTLCVAIKDKERTCVSRLVQRRPPSRLSSLPPPSPRPRRAGRGGQVSHRRRQSLKLGAGLGCGCGLLSQTVIRHGAVDYDDSPDGGEGSGKDTQHRHSLGRQ
ncbi:hypothetical protein B0J15DRAFT_471407 [Fusarium solani]|uniref:Uncharacterized protein n=1 Tax=Fusarium solani TaxID=169388 RepID=A0A9P9G8W5_FUSSL|nr:uncharacterized protein B0J15DRAFT_471407 [Fusarium solani]KAH7235180.1 hypothetical protein B0J15DRAFT_471407 [Fusarium solani]